MESAFATSDLRSSAKSGLFPTHDGSSYINASDHVYHLHPSHSFNVNSARSGEVNSLENTPRVVEDIAPRRRPRSWVTVDERLKIISFHEEHQGATHAHIASVFGICRSTITKILLEKEEWLTTLRKETSGQSLLRESKHKYTEQKMRIWLAWCVEKNMVLTDAALRKKALWFHVTYARHESFKASPTWIRRFKRRHKINAGVIDVKSVEELTVEEKLKYPTSLDSLYMDVWLSQFPERLPSVVSSPVDIRPPIPMDPQDYVPAGGETFLEDIPPSPTRNLAHLPGEHTSSIQRDGEVKIDSETVKVSGNEAINLSSQPTRPSVDLASRGHQRSRLPRHILQKIRSITSRQPSMQGLRLPPKMVFLPKIRQIDLLRASQRSRSRSRTPPAVDDAMRPSHGITLSAVPPPVTPDIAPLPQLRKAEDVPLNEPNPKRQKTVREQAQPSQENYASSIPTSPNLHTVDPVPSSHTQRAVRTTSPDGMTLNDVHALLNQLSDFGQRTELFSPHHSTQLFAFRDSIARVVASGHNALQSGHSSSAQDNTSI